MKYASLMDRIVANSVEEAGTGCWVWMGKKRHDYAQMSVRVDGKHKTLRVIRVVLRETTGDEGKGMHAGHKSHCHNASCVNPKHLEWTTPDANCAEMWGRRRAR